MQLFLTEALEEIVVATIIEGVNELGQLWVVMQHLKNVRTIDDLREGGGECTTHKNTLALLQDHFHTNRRLR